MALFEIKKAGDHLRVWRIVFHGFI